MNRLFFSKIALWLLDFLTFNISFLLSLFLIIIMVMKNIYLFMKLMTEHIFMLF